MQRNQPLRILTEVVLAIGRFSGYLNRRQDGYPRMASHVARYEKLEPPIHDVRLSRKLSG